MRTFTPPYSPLVLVLAMKKIGDRIGWDGNTRPALLANKHKPPEYLVQDLDDASTKRTCERANAVFCKSNRDIRYLCGCMVSSTSNIFELLKGHRDRLSVSELARDKNTCAAQSWQVSSPMAYCELLAFLSSTMLCLQLETKCPWQVWVRVFFTTANFWCQHVSTG